MTSGADDATLGTIPLSRDALHTALRMTAPATVHRNAVRRMAREMWELIDRWNAMEAAAHVDAHPDG